MTRRTPTGERERGAVLVEAAIILPLLLTMLFGLIEVGFAWRADNEVSRGVRASVLEQSRNSGERFVDLRTLELVVASVSKNEDLEWVMVYRTAASSLEPPASCVSLANVLATDHVGLLGTCTIYSGTFAFGATTGDFTDPDCIGDPDQNLCPANRDTLFGTNDRLGVAVKVNHDWVLGFLPGGGVDIEDHAVSPILTGIGDVG